jgi:hypothetical protein
VGEAERSVALSTLAKPLDFFLFAKAVLAAGLSWIDIDMTATERHLD